MELKKGYKQTEIGVIPDDWEVKELGEISDLTSSKRIFESDYVSSGIPFYRGKEISLLNKNQRLTEEYYISESKYNSIVCIFGAPKKDDILITAVGTLANTYLIPNENKFYFKDGNLIWLKNLKKIVPKYLNIQLDWSQNLILSNAIGSSQKALTIISLKNTLLAIPPTIEEQIAIANAITDIDDLISALEKKIEKKKNIKQGAMQELLKPKEGWVEKSLGEIGNTYGGLTGKSKVHFGQGNALYIPFMNILSNPIIDINNFERVIIGGKEKQNKVLVGDLFFNTSSETPEEVGICSVILDEIENLYLNSFCFGYRLTDKEISGLYLSYFFRTKIGRDLMTALAQGATRYNLSKSLFNQLKILLPNSIQEQNNICDIINDMDKEIEGLVEELEKYRMMKEGMMKDLLTGRIRLI